MLNTNSLVDLVSKWYFGVILVSLCVAGSSSFDLLITGSLILLFGLVNLICYVPMVGKMLFRKNQYLHRSVTSDIPGNPHAFDDAIISLMRTLPEPANFNVCWTGIVLGGNPFRIEGVVPPATINSLSLYSRTTSDPPVTLDLSTLKLAPGKRFNVVLAPVSCPDITSLLKGQDDVGVIAYPDHWEGGFIAMRNYAVQNGTRVITPTVLSIPDGTVMRPSESLVAGLTASKGLDILKVLRVVAFNTLIFGTRVCRESWPLIERQVLVGGLITGYALYYLLFQLGKRGLHKHISLICPHLHQFRRPDDGEASKVSQPSEEHQYWLMRFDMNSLSGSDVMIKAAMKSNGQKYWSLTLYNEYGLPMPQFVNVFNTTSTTSSSGSSSASDSAAHAKKYNIEIRLTLNPKEASSDASPKVATAHATVDMRQTPSGYAIFRIVHPTHATTQTLSAPVATLVKAV
jgi:hypothetical protein